MSNNTQISERNQTRGHSIGLGQNLRMGFCYIPNTFLRCYGKYFVKCGQVTA